MQVENRALAVSEQPSFTQSEWESCLEVLKSVQEDTTMAPDRERLERLIARVYKRVRKRRRQRGEEPITGGGRRQGTGPRNASGRQASIAGKAIDLHGNYTTESVQPENPARSQVAICYTCRQRFHERHCHYGQLCPACAEFQFQKRNQRADLRGRRALVTGGRIKIGFETALKFLRDGAEVLVTTRFASDAARRFAAQRDFGDWQQRLQIYRLDFRDVRSVLAFTRYLVTTLNSLDILVNNAAQTIRRPPQYHQRLEALEQVERDSFAPNLQSLPRVVSMGRFPDHIESTAELHCSVAPVEESALPAEPFDEFGEPVDLRDRNSWVLRLEDVSPVELLEVLLINTAAPYLLTSELKPLFLRSPFPERYVVNVVGADGLFNLKRKSANHPHLNMSKAALNMMTRTSAADLASDGIFMNSVDTGWITHEGPHPQRMRLRAMGIAPPLDVIDGAARIYDPIVCGINGQRLYGLLFRNYAPASW
ncbi:MAG: SDR family NAD(P)-dependent oxidoreductase [Thermoguttaceae bacterium]